MCCLYFRLVADTGVLPTYPSRHILAVCRCQLLWFRSIGVHDLGQSAPRKLRSLRIKCKGETASEEACSLFRIDKTLLVLRNWKVKLKRGCLLLLFIKLLSVRLARLRYGRLSSREKPDIVRGKRHALTLARKLGTFGEAI